MGEKGSVKLHVLSERLYSYWARRGLNVDEDTVLMSVLEAGGEEMERQMKVLGLYRSIQNSQSTWHLEMKDMVLAKAEVGPWIRKPQRNYLMIKKKESWRQNVRTKLEDDWLRIRSFFHNARNYKEIEFKKRNDLKDTFILNLFLI